MVVKNAVFSLLSLFFLLPLTAQNTPEPSKKLVETQSVFFDFARHEIRPEADSILTLVASKSLNLDHYELEIIAHTDSIGNIQNNQALSRRRALAVIDVLSKKGLDTSRISFNYKGELEPQATNDSEQGRQLNRRAEIQIFEKASIPMTKLQGQIKDEETGEGIRADIVIHSKIMRDSFQTNEDGSFERLVPQNQVIGVDVYAEGYFYQTEMLKTSPGKIPQLSVTLPKAKIGESIDIKNLYFVGNEDILLAKSKPELPKLLKFMELNRYLKIEIAGHINLPNRRPVEKDTWHYDLSRRRAQRIYEYLLANGIGEERMIFKGYGNWQMRFPEATSEKEQALNRRVEIKILETGEKVSEE